MAEPMSRELFLFLCERAGLDPAKIGDERFEELREGTRFVPRLQHSVRRRRAGQARDRTAEPAHVFVHPKG